MTRSSHYPWGEVLVTRFDGRAKRKRIGVLVSPELAVTESTTILSSFVLTHIPTGGIVAGDSSFGCSFYSIDRAIEFAEFLVGKLNGENIVTQRGLALTVECLKEFPKDLKAIE